MTNRKLQYWVIPPEADAEWEVLTGRDQSPPFAHLSAEGRQVALEILRDTKPGLPAYWQAGGQREDAHDE